MVAEERLEIRGVKVIVSVHMEVRIIIAGESWYSVDVKIVM